MRKPPHSVYIDRTMNDQPIPPREEEDPRERDLARRSNAPAVNPWLIVALIALLGAMAYVASALL